MSPPDQPARPICRPEVNVELHVSDFAPVREFYGALGFAVARESENTGQGGYLVMQRDTVSLRFWPGDESYKDQSYFRRFAADTPRGYGVEIIIMVADLDAIYELAGATGAVVQELKLRPWGVREFRIVDPFGYYIRFADPHEVVSFDIA